jgi:poly(3-hydroxybutyrate) depolymerase
MLYDAYEVQRSFLAGASKLAGLGAGWLNNPSNPFSYSSMGPLVAASLECSPTPRRRAASPSSGSTSDRWSAARRRRGHEEIVLRKPFGQLKHFREGSRRRASRRC